jgi:hypothetical protein
VQSTDGPSVAVGDGDVGGEGDGVGDSDGVAVGEPGTS